MTAANNRYLDAVKARRTEDIHAVPAHLREAPPVDPRTDKIDLSVVAWQPIATGAIVRNVGMRINKTNISLPRDPFASGAKYAWVRLGALPGVTDALVLAFSAQAGPDAVRRGTNVASFGGEPLVRRLAVLGWERGEYEVIDKGNCWIVTKRRLR